MIDSRTPFGGKVKFLSGSGGTPAPPVYRNYLGLISGSFANQEDIDTIGGEIYIPFNNVSRDTISSDRPANTFYTNFQEAGQNVNLYIEKVVVVISNINDGGSPVNGIFNVTLNVDNVSVGEVLNEVVSGQGTITITLATPVQVVDTAFVSLLESEGRFFSIVSCNALFFSTGLVAPPTTCQYFQNIGSVLGIAQCTMNGLTPSQTSTPTNFPLVAQGNIWRSSIQFTNFRPKIRYVTSFPSDPTATLIDGEYYYVEATFSQTCNTNVLLYFGTSGTNPDIVSKINYSALILGNTTAPQGFYIIWNPTSDAQPLFLFGLQNGLSVANAFNGTLTFNIGTQYC